MVTEGFDGSLVVRLSRPVTGPIAVAVKPTWMSTYAPAATSGMIVGLVKRSVLGLVPPHCSFTDSGAPPMLVIVSGFKLVAPSGTLPRSIIAGLKVSCGGVSLLPVIGTLMTPLFVVTTRSIMCFAVERGV